MHFVLIGWFLMLVGNHANRTAVHYDAPVPDRCATFEQRYDATTDNPAYCDKWEREHFVRVGPKE